jgi:hypothetical protein
VYGSLFLLFLGSVGGLNIFGSTNPWVTAPSGLFLRFLVLVCHCAKCIPMAGGNGFIAFYFENLFRFHSTTFESSRPVPQNKLRMSEYSKKPFLLPWRCRNEAVHQGL